jgi:transcriptional regulator with XRE-family HTH domain
MKLVGGKITKIRKAKGVTMRELAKLSGNSQANISDIENGKVAQPRPDTIRNLAKALQVEVDTLYEIESVTGMPILYMKYLSLLSDEKNAPWLDVISKAHDAGIPLSLFQSITAWGESRQRDKKRAKG